MGFVGLQCTLGSLPLEGKVVSEANRMRWRRKENWPKPAPSSVCFADSLFCGSPPAFIPLALNYAAGIVLFRAYSSRGTRHR